MTRHEAYMELRQQILKCERIYTSVERGLENWGDKIRSARGSIVQREQQLAKVF